MSHRSDKGWTDVYLFLFRDGPLEITGGRVKNVWCMNFFKKPACLQEFFSRAYDLLFFGITACRNFYFGNCHPTSGYFQWSFPYQKIHRLSP